MGQDIDTDRSNPTGRRAIAWTWVVAVVGIVISVLLFLLVERAERQRDKTEFHSQVSSYLNAFLVFRNGAEDILRSFRALFYQNPNLSRQLFTNTVVDLSIRTDGMQVVGWAPRVPKAQRSGLEEAVRQEGFPNFQITEGDLTHFPDERPSRAGDRDEYFPLMFLEPMAGNELAMGYDLASEPTVAELLGRSHGSGGVELSGPLELPSSSGVVSGALAAVPVYGPEFLPTSKEERSKQLKGFVVAVFVIDDLLAAVERRAQNLRLDVMLLDATTPGQEIEMGVRVQGTKASGTLLPSPASFRASHHHSQPLTIGSRKLVALFRQGQNWDPGFGHWLPVAVLVVALLLTGLAVQLVRSSIARAARIEAMVHVRTAELALANTKLQSEVKERLEAQNQLARERNLLYLLLNQLPDAVFVTDRQEKYVLANRAQVSLLRQSDPAELIGKPVWEVGLPALAAALGDGSMEVLQSDKAVFGQEKNVVLPGELSMTLEVSKLPFRDAKGDMDGLLVISRDVTAQRHADAEKVEFTQRLQETQKLESLGLLAGGIAHDFNNLLTVILGNASLARLEVSEYSPVVDNLRQIEVTSLRAADLCRQMLAYSGKGRFIVRRIDLSKLVEQTTELLRLSISKKATLSSQLAEDLPPVLADATQLQQILMNLVINSSEALGTESGSIEITTGFKHVDRDYLHHISKATDIAEGDYVFLEVSDTGSGMSQETQAKIFDPFYTTKFTGRGLGLAAVLGIVRGHRGAITVHSEPGKGTTFRLLLPCAEGTAEAEETPKSDAEIGKFSGTILVVDDEESVRSTAARILEHSGFAVDQADNGMTALEKFSVSPDIYRAVLLDLTMPQMDGEETFKEIRRLKPGARVLLMSGFSTQEVVGRFGEDAPGGFIQKPFLPKALLEALRDLLESEATPAV